MNEYDELKAAGMSDHNIRMLRNTGASHGAILAWARDVPQCPLCHGERSANLLAEPCRACGGKVA